MTDTEVETVVEQITHEDVVPYEEDKADKHRLTHLINPPSNLHIYQPGMTAQEIVDIARMLQTTIKALCGYEFIPKYNPEQYDVCQACMDIAAGIIKERG